MANESESGWTGGQRSVGDIAPALAHYTDTVLFDEVWERPELAKRDRSLAIVAAEHRPLHPGRTRHGTGTPSCRVAARS
jgi:hypothetical protein